VIGSVVSIGISLLVDDVLTNATTVIVTVKKPDDTTITPGVVHDGLGIYHCDVDTSSGPPGGWHYHVTSTGTAAGAGQGEFIVEANNTA
jgi:hypothetical protein